MNNGVLDKNENNTDDMAELLDLYQDFVVREKEDTDTIILVGMQQNCVLIFMQTFFSRTSGLQWSES